MSKRVVVVFASRSGATEKLAMTAAVGAVEARGEIRLRRLPDSGHELRPESAWLAKEYVAPRDADVAWADALIFLAPGWLDPASVDLDHYFSTLAALCTSGRWRVTEGAVLATGEAGTAIERQMSGLGLRLIPLPPADSVREQARLLGRSVAGREGT